MNNFINNQCDISRPILAKYRELSNTQLYVLSFIVPMSEQYPDIEKWFLNKVVPGENDGTRRVICLERENKIAAVGIAKAEADEKKICSVRVANEYIGRGLGVRVFEELLNWLGEDKPHLTVSEEKYPMFESLFEYYGFKMTSATAGLYLPNSIELGFNEKKCLLD